MKARLIIISEGDRRYRPAAAKAYCRLKSYFKTFAEPKVGIPWKRARPFLLCTGDFHFEKMMIHEFSINEHVASISEIAQIYWNDFADDRPTDRFTLRKIAADLIGPINRLIEINDYYSSQAMRDLHRESWRRKKVGPPRQYDHIKNLLSSAQWLKTELGPIAERSFTKGANITLTNACSQLWTLWEKIAGREFIRSWETDLGTADPATKIRKGQFVNADPLFVQVAMQAIDPKLTYSQIRTALKRVAKDRPA